MTENPFPPNWFSLEKYLSKTASMGALEWSYALEVRSWLWEFLANPSSPYLELFFTQEKARGELYQLFMRQTELDVANPEPNSGFNFRLLPRAPQSVRSVSLGSLALNWDLLISRPNLKPLAQNIQKLNDRGLDKEQSRVLNELIETPIELIYELRGEAFLDLSSGAVFAEIDIDAPDEKLIEDFKVWLHSYRQTLGIASQRKLFSHSDFIDWHEKRLLPFSDLCIYAKLHGLEPTQHQLGHILFPDKPDITPSEKIRKTIRPAFEKLIARRTYRALRAQASVS